MAKIKSYKNTDEEFTKAVKENKSIAGVLRALKLSAFGASYGQYRKRVKHLGLDTSHFTGQGHRAGSTTSYTPPRPLKEVMVKDSNYNTGKLKKRLLIEGILENKCVLCGQLPEWNGKPLVLQLDHINGISNDHRLENVRILCGHCHSQTITFCGKNKPKNLERHESFTKRCVDCKKKVINDSKRCKDCFDKFRKDNPGVSSITGEKINYNGESAGHSYHYTKEDAEAMLEVVMKTNIKTYSDNENIDRGTVRETLKKYGLYEKLRECKNCGESCSQKSKLKLCEKCFDGERIKFTGKVENHPTKDQLKVLLWEKSTTQIAKDFGVSDNAVAKWAKKYELEKPARGYWRKKETGNL